MASSVSPSLDALADRHYQAGDFTRKSVTYLNSYARLLEGRREAKLAILELGVSSGASLLVWRDYMPNATIVGIDIAEPPDCVVEQERIHFIRGSQDDPLTLDKAAEAAGRSFDLIIDDASHIGYLTKRSLHYLFPRWLVPGGWYVIEDFGTGFLPQYPDGTEFTPPDWNDAQPGTQEFQSSRFGMVGVIKQLVDHLMQELATGAPSYLAIERLIVETNIAFIEKSRMPAGAWPGCIVDRPRPPATAAPVPPPPTSAGTSAGTPLVPSEVYAALANHAARIAELERVISQLRRGLSPVLWLRRLVRR